MFDTVLVANRGEIAVRVMASLRRLGIQSVGVYSDADVDARHVREADRAVSIGPALAAHSYLNVDRILDAAARTGAQAIHPGYGFLSENADFVRACERAGLVFIGPTADAVEIMGDKIRAKQTVSAAGVAVVPGRATPGMSDDDLVAAAEEVGYPVLVKPSAGGGGKGMRLVESRAQLGEALAGARREAAASFGDDTLFLERYVARPRHIEVQVLADEHGNTVHLGERECSLQRRHQKIIEEAPSVLLDEHTRSRVTASAVATARAVGYRGVGTVEFIVAADAPEEFFFMEMNTRLQVEHPVSEMITGIDLVEQQLRVAAGERLAFTQDEIHLTGHAIAARVYAEDPNRGFLPTGGRVLVLREPRGEGIRVDSSLIEGIEIGTNYDPLLAKVIAVGPDRATALARLDRALADTVVLGMSTNTTFLRALLADPEVRLGELDTGLIEREMDRLVPDRSADPGPSLEVCAAFALSQLRALHGNRSTSDRWDEPDGWRLGDHAATRWTVVTSDDSALEISVVGGPGAALVTRDRLDASGNGTTSTVAAAVRDGAGMEPHEMAVTVDGRALRVLGVIDGASTWLWMDGVTSVVQTHSWTRRRGESGRGDGEIRSPMPGTVLAVTVAAGDVVERGERLVVVEAMKMENALVAPFTGVVSEVEVAVGDQVVVDQLLVRVAPEDATADLSDGRSP